MFPLHISAAWLAGKDCFSNVIFKVRTRVRACVCDLFEESPLWAPAVDLTLNQYTCWPLQYSAKWTSCCPLRFLLPKRIRLILKSLMRNQPPMQKRNLILSYIVTVGRIILYSLFMDGLCLTIVWEQTWKYVKIPFLECCQARLWA